MFFYCVEKNNEILNKADRKGVSFDDAIEEILEGNYLVVNNKSKKHIGQACFLIELDNYPFVIPFNINGRTFQLITMFPDRRYKNG